MIDSPTFDGTLSLYRCYGCTFQIVRKRGELAGHYRLTRVQIPLAQASMP